MKLSFNVLGFEIWNLQVDQLHREVNVVADVAEVIEHHSEKALKTGIKKMSGFWVKWMMR